LVTIIDLREFVGASEAIVASHRHGPEGGYRRWNWQDSAGERDLGVSPYGCADAANILYTIGRFPSEPEPRAASIAQLQALQSAETGMFEEPTHHPIHTTAHCLAALELFDAPAAHRLAGLQELAAVAAMERFLAGLDWRGTPWRESHRGAGLFAAMVIAGAVDLEWQDAYFAWLWNHTDPATGLIGGTDLQPVAHSGTVSMVPHMAGTFHYLFNMQSARRPSRYPDKLVDSCLAMLDAGTFPLGERVGFAEIDWFFCLNRSLRQTPHRFEEGRRAMAKLGRRLADFVLALDPQSDDGLNDLHSLFGTLCAFAELQQALPGLVRTDRPLKLVLDRRPFI
jgi:hypothetical protein